MKRGKLTLAVSVICGALCAACVALYMQGVRGEADAARAEALERYGGEQLEVCVAKRDIAAGQAVTDADVEMRMWVADLLPDEAARSVEEVEGRVPTSPIMEGEAVVLKRFEGHSASLDVPDGLAALSVPAKDVQTVGGALSEGAVADLYAVGGTSTSLLARDVLILATSSSGSEGTDAELSWVTVAVEPESVQEVIDSAQRSELYFAVSSDSAASGGSDADEAGTRDDAGKEDDAR